MILNTVRYSLDPRPPLLTSLVQVWRGEYTQDLTNRQIGLVNQDFEEAIADEGISAMEYRRRIGLGNLQSYAECLEAGERRKRTDSPSVFGDRRQAD